MEPYLDRPFHDPIGDPIRHSFSLNPLLWPPPPHVLNLIQNYRNFQFWPVHSGSVLNLPEPPKTCGISPLNYTTDGLT